MKAYHTVIIGVYYFVNIDHIILFFIMVYLTNTVGEIIFNLILDLNTLIFNVVKQLPVKKRVM